MIVLSEKPNNFIDTHVWRRIRGKAKQLVGKAGFQAADREDIEQELALRVWRSIQNYRPEMGCSDAFVTTVLQRAANSLLRLRNSSKRGRRHLHQSLISENKVPEESRHGVEATYVLCCTDRSHEIAVELAHDVAVVLSQLPSPLQELAHELKEYSAAEIARRKGLSRSTIYARMAHLRAAFVAADLKIFSRPSDTSRAFCEVN